MSEQGQIHHPDIEKLLADIAQMEETVVKLRAEGHIYTDAERHLKQLKQKLVYRR